jgi:hypothetical protein
MTIIKPISRRWFLVGLIAAPVIVAASNIMPVRAMEWIGAPRWEGTAGHFAWRTRPDKLVPTNRRFAWCQDRTTKISKRWSFLLRRCSQISSSCTEGERNPASTIDFDAHRHFPSAARRGEHTWGWPGQKRVHAHLRRAMPGHDTARGVTVSI